MQQTIAFGCEFWNDSCDPEELEQAVIAGATGATSNPVLVAKAINRHRDRFGEFLRQKIKDQPTLSEDRLCWELIAQLAKESAELLSNKGTLSLQVNPIYFNSPTLMYEHGKELAQLADNISIKVPTTEAGLQAMEELTADGININATVSFSVSQAIQAAKAVERGRKKCSEPDRLNPYITIMVGRVEDYLIRVFKTKKVSLPPEHLHWSGIAVFKKAYKEFQARGYSSTLLSAAYRHQLHWTELVGPNVVQSIPFEWWQRFNSSKTPIKETIHQSVDEEILHSLQQNFDEFSLIYDEHKLNSSDYLKLDATKTTLQQFLGGLDEMRYFVRSILFS